jgi:hypothetical protein
MEDSYLQRLMISSDFRTYAPVGHEPERSLIASYQLQY